MERTRRVRYGAHLRRNFARSPRDCASMYAAIDCSPLGQAPPPREIITSITSVMLKEERKATCQALFLLTLSLKLQVQVNIVNRVAI